MKMRSVKFIGTLAVSVAMASTSTGVFAQMAVRVAPKAVEARDIGKIAEAALMGQVPAEKQAEAAKDFGKRIAGQSLTKEVVVSAALATFVALSGSSAIAEQKFVRVGDVVEAAVTGSGNNVQDVKDSLLLLGYTQGNCALTRDRSLGDTQADAEEFLGIQTDFRNLQATLAAANVQFKGDIPSVMQMSVESPGVGAGSRIMLGELDAVAKEALATGVSGVALANRLHNHGMELFAATIPGGLDALPPEERAEQIKDLEQCLLKFGA